MENYEELLKDAQRWRMARQLLTARSIHTAQASYENYGCLATEDVNILADRAIDLCIEKEKELG